MIPAKPEDIETWVYKPYVPPPPQPVVPDANNDWTLDVNVIINANIGGGGTARRVVQGATQNGWMCWSSSVAQAYQIRGAVNLLQGCPPVPVDGKEVSWFQAWLTRPDLHISTPKIQKLTGSEKEALVRIPFQDEDDLRFLELARSSHSHRLVTEEEDFNKHAVQGIRRILDVRCFDYAAALDECQQ
jgi:predicted nucleic acid-binding protein